MLGSDMSAGPVSLPVAGDNAAEEGGGVEDEEGERLDNENGYGLADNNIEDMDDTEPLTAAGEAVLYVSAEESVEQVSRPSSIA